RWYALPANDQGLSAVSLDLTSRAQALVVRTDAGEVRTPIGIGKWVLNATGFANGIERMLSVPSPTPVALSGAWASDSVFTVKIVAPETPFYSTIVFRFSGERVTIAGEQHVSFGPTTMPVLEGTLISR